MIDEKIKELLDSDLEDDNKVGWELIEAKKVPFCDVLDYVEKAKVPTGWKQRYVWNNGKFVKNGSVTTYSGPVINYPISSAGTGGYVLTTDETGTITWATPTYTTSNCVVYSGGSLR